LLSVFMVQPIIRNAIVSSDKKKRRPVAILMGYVAYLFVFAAGPEELSVAFAVIAAFLVYYGSLEQGEAAASGVALVQLTKDS
jgi:hypothetical protein